MDTFYIKLEKRNAILKHRQLYKIANVLRFVEICVVLVLISRFTIHLPVAVKSSGEYFRGLSVVLVSPRFVFIVGNAIVITLFAKAGQFSTQDSSTSGTDLYEEFVEKSEKSRAIHRYEIEYREKQSEKSADQEKTVSLNVHTSKGTKNYRRTQSENLKQRMNCKKACRQLRKLESEKYIKHSEDSDEEMAKSSYPEDGLSNEQFRNAVEAFIARQKKASKGRRVLSDLERFRVTKSKILVLLFLVFFRLLILPFVWLLYTTMYMVK